MIQEKLLFNQLLLFLKKDLEVTLNSIYPLKQKLKNSRKLQSSLKKDANTKFKLTLKFNMKLFLDLSILTKFSVRDFVLQEEEMLGSFGPQKDNHSVTFPKQGWDSAPKGTLARGSYTAKSKFIDDDKQTHMQYEYSFQIKKDWQ